MLPNLDPDINVKVKRMPGIELRVTEKCTGCGLCLEKCFVHTITIQNGKAIIGANCKGCGRCAECCPNKAIELIINDTQFIKKTIDCIESSVDVG
jgi:MinD superfamily P-loop ATPase